MRARLARGSSRVFVFVLLFLGVSAAEAHEVRPGFLELTELTAGRFQLLWKLPLLGDRVLPLDPVLPPGCAVVGEPAVEWTTGALLERALVDCGEGGLLGGEIAIANLEMTLIDVLVRVELADGSVFSSLLRPEAPRFEVTRGGSGPRLDYVRMGVEHILLGVDHLLFVLGLLLIVDGGWRLVQTITAFTVAHSLTLGLATFGVLVVSPQAVEAVVALSIVFLAVELVHKKRGRVGLTERRPWLVSFSFGLLHGLGFAGALVALGLPRTEIPVALLMFNVGVEIGQLLFVGVALLVLGLAKRRLALSGLVVPPWTVLVTAYLIGTFAASWFWSRFVGLLG